MSIDKLSQLKVLKLFGIATALAEIRAETPRLALIQTVLYTDSSTLNWQIDMRVAYAISLALLNFLFIGIGLALTGWLQSPLPQTQIQQLALAAFMEEAHILILVGGTGTGKSHWATAMGVVAIQKVNGFVFTMLSIRLMNLKEKSRPVNQGGMLRRLIQVDAVIVDELGKRNKNNSFK